jgi:hypothetical protein
LVGRPYSRGSTGKPIKSELHHWWPKGLSRFWADTESKVTRLSWNGELLRLEPAKFGAIRNAHRIRLEGPWDTSVEPLFDDADGNLPRIVELLEGYPIPEVQPGLSYIHRAVDLAVSPEDRAVLGECLASLVVRCPANRDRLHRTTEAFWGRTGDQVRKPDDSLIAGNIHQHYRQVVSSLQHGGKIVLLRPATSEFVMGEGYLNTLVGMTVELQYRCLVPFTPTLAVLAFAPQRYLPNPAVSMLSLTDDEVDIVNEITQVYTRDYLFFRSRHPPVTEPFTRHEFLSVRYHKHPWTEAVMESIAGVSQRASGLFV